MSAPAISTERLTKFYGNVRGVEELDLEVERGEVFGFLGPNGAGKTTTMRVLMGFLRPSAGRATVLGRDAWEEAVAIHRRVGYLPGDLRLYERFTTSELVELFSGLRGTDHRRQARALAERFDLDVSRPVKQLSKGNRQKVGLVLAFMHDPEVYLLDEPTSGLDPLMQLEFNALIRERRDAGAAVFLSSHVLSEVERIADRVAIVREGRLVVVERLDELKAKAIRRIEIQFAEPVAVEDFAGIENVRAVQVEGTVLRAEVVGEIDALVKAAARHRVVNIVSEEPDLEELFLAYYDGSAHGGVADDA